MIYLSAQPDSFYFLWQIRLLLNNLNRLGVVPDRIHVLVAYDTVKGISEYFANFISSNKQASFFCYADTRENAEYASSIRPHVISKHFKSVPSLENEVIFYHDSDIIFTKLPCFETLLNERKWYASDTASYTGIKYIKEVGGEELFKCMCSVINVSPELVEHNSHYSGGAQYILRSVTSAFWSELEDNCENMFCLINEHNNASPKVQPKLQAWCADMWCLWWAAIKKGVAVETHPELDFLWANDPIKANKKIVHYTGSIPLLSKSFFRKNNYNHCTPFFDDFSAIDRNSASFLVVEEIENYIGSNLKKRAEIVESTIVILCETSRSFDFLLLQAALKYIQLNLDCEILVLEVGLTERIRYSDFSEEISYHFILKNLSGNEADILARIVTDFVIIQSYCTFVGIEQLKNASNLVKAANGVVIPYSKVLQVDSLLLSMFVKLMDIDLFRHNEGKMLPMKTKDFGGCCIMGSKIYIGEMLSACIAGDVTFKSKQLCFSPQISHIDSTIYHYGLC